MERRASLVIPDVGVDFEPQQEIDGLGCHLEDGEMERSESSLK